MTPGPTTTPKLRPGQTQDAHEGPKGYPGACKVEGKCFLEAISAKGTRTRTNQDGKAPAKGLLPSIDSGRPAA